VSQIWSLMGLLSIVIMRAPNSTPMVRSCTGWKRLSVNCSSRHDFPTPATQTNKQPTDQSPLESTDTDYHTTPGQQIPSRVDPIQSPPQGSGRRGSGEQRVRKRGGDGPVSPMMMYLKR
jgi:hypothetical protein